MRIMKIKLSLITKVATLSDTDEDLTAKDPPVTLSRLVNCEGVPHKDVIVQRLQDSRLVVQHATVDEFEIIEGELVPVVHLTEMLDDPACVFDSELVWMLANGWTKEPGDGEG